MIYIGADHRGFSLKEKIKEYLNKKNISFSDLGNDKYEEEDDFVDFAQAVARKVAGEINSYGIVICGSGVGVSIAANKISKVRCGLVFNKEMVRQARVHGNINVLALPADFITTNEAFDTIDVFLKTKFSGGLKYQRRIDKISYLEK